MTKEYFIIQTGSITINSAANNKTIDLNNLKGVIDFSIKNSAPLGASTITVNINGVDAFTLAPGDPMLMLGGYENAYRRDKINLIFSAGAMLAHCLYNKRVSTAECLI